MNKFLSIRFAILFIALAFFSNSTHSQNSVEWNRDSVLSSLRHIFPTAYIKLIDSGHVEPIDTMLNGWMMKAAIVQPSDTNQIFFYFYQLKDTALFSRLLQAAINSQIAVMSTLPNPYFISFPFADTTYNKVLLYQAITNINKEHDEYEEMEKNICTYFKVPHYNTSIKIELVEVKSDPRPSPPPPPPPKPGSQKNKSKRNGN